MYRIENGTAVIYPESRIDSVNVKEFEKEANAALEQSPDGGLILDGENLGYISSAGLRALLTFSGRLKKRIAVRNASPEVYEILDMTGLTNLMVVHRRIRSIDVTGCEVIGRGATAVVYRVAPDIIVKVYESKNALELIRHEQQCAKKALLKGIPTAISYDAVRVGEHYGSMFELLDAQTFADLLAKAPERTDELVGIHAELMHQMHKTEAMPGELPDCREVFLRYLDDLEKILPQDMRARLEALLRAMPQDLHMVHGDFHMRNIMNCAEGPLLIDMSTLSMGNPVFELGNLYVAYQAFIEDQAGGSEEVIGFTDEQCRLVWDKTLKAYLNQPDAESLEKTLKRIRVAAYMRYLYLVAVDGAGGADLAETRIRNTLDRLNRLLPEVDSLEI